jgi:hypothetical protein
MSQSTKFSPRASLIALGNYLENTPIWQIIEQEVKIKQKVLQHTPTDKLKDAWISMLAGAQSLVELNTLVRPDKALQKAFGREGCADQSTVSETLNVCNVMNVKQMQIASRRIYQRYGKGYGHHYGKHMQILDVDMSGLVCGEQAEGAEKGYFPNQKGKRGRQLGRVVASRYDEVVVDQLYAGKRQLNKSLTQLVLAAEDVLELDEPRRQQTLIRVDSGGGKAAHINWVLERGYAVLIKSTNWRYARQQAEQVETWVQDPRRPDRELAWCPEPIEFDDDTQQLLIRKHTRNGDYKISLIIAHLPDTLLVEQTDLPVTNSQERLIALAYLYDQRSGGVETQFKNDKQGLGLHRRNKKSFAAQEMLVLLAQLAHNLMIWMRNALTVAAHPRFRKYGVLRLVRDVCQIAGQIIFDEQGNICEIRLNRHHPLARYLVRLRRTLQRQSDSTLNLGEI